MCGKSWNYLSSLRYSKIQPKIISRFFFCSVYNKHITVPFIHIHIHSQTFNLEQRTMIPCTCIYNNIHVFLCRRVLWYNLILVRAFEAGNSIGISEINVYGIPQFYANNAYSHGSQFCPAITDIKITVSAWACTVIMHSTCFLK